MKFLVTITRVESFVIEADEADSAVDAAFDLSSHREKSSTGRKTKYGALVLGHDWETIAHEVSESEEEEVNHVDHV